MLNPWDDDHMQGLRDTGAQPDADMQAIIWAEAAMGVCLIVATMLGAPWYVFLFLLIGMLAPIVGYCIDGGSA